MIRQKDKYKLLSNIPNSKGVLILMVMCISVLLYMGFIFIRLTWKVSNERSDLLMIEFYHKMNDTYNNDLKQKRQELIFQRKYLEKEVKDSKESIEIIRKDYHHLTSLRENYEIEKKVLHTKLLFKNEQENDYSNILAKDEELKYILSSIQELKQNIRFIKRSDFKQTHKLLSIDSQILSNDSQYDLINKWFRSNRKYQWHLIYRITDSSGDVKHFHSEVDQYSNTLCLLKLKDGSIIGGYTTLSWSGHGHHIDPKAFLFNLSNQLVYRVRPEQHAINTNPGFFVSFGNIDLRVYSNSVVSFFPSFYGDHYCEEYGLTNGKRTQRLIEFELFHLS